MQLFNLIKNKRKFLRVWLIEKITLLFLLLYDVLLIKTELLPEENNYWKKVNNLEVLKKLLAIQFYFLLVFHQHQNQKMEIMIMDFI